MHDIKNVYFLFNKIVSQPAPSAYEAHAQHHRVREQALPCLCAVSQRATFSHLL